MATLGEMPKPDASQYMEKRKLFLVPNYVFPPDMPDEGQELAERYWSEVRDHVQKLESSLGPVHHVFHEMMFEDGDEGMDMLDAMNPLGSPFIRTLCSSSAALRVTEDRATVEENMDWQMCMSAGLMSEKVMNLAMEGVQETMKRRYEQIGTRIDAIMKNNDNGVLFIREDHRVQFPSDIQVFYVAPPALDTLKRWITQQSQSQAAAQAAAQSQQPQ